MSINTAQELVRQLGQAIEIPDLDFSELAIDLKVDDEAVSIEYLVSADTFLIHTVITKLTDKKDTASRGRLLTYAHMSAMMGGPALTLDEKAGRVVLSQRLELDGLTANRLGSWIGQMASSTAVFRELLDEPVLATPTGAELGIRI